MKTLSKANQYLQDQLLKSLVDCGYAPVVTWDIEVGYYIRILKGYKYGSFDNAIFDCVRYPLGEPVLFTSESAANQMIANLLEGY